MLCGLQGKDEPTGSVRSCEDAAETRDAAGPRDGGGVGRTEQGLSGGSGIWQSGAGGGCVVCEGRRLMGLSVPCGACLDL